MRVAFAGTPAFSVPALLALLAAPAVELAAVFTQPDRRAGRGRLARASAVKMALKTAAETSARAHEVPVFQFESWRDGAAAAQLARLKPELMVVVAYGLLLPEDALAIPRLGCVNLHASLLPRWRGAAPIQRAIEAGDSLTGISLMRMERRLDSGAVLASAALPLAADDTSGSLHAKLAQLAGRLLSDNLTALAEARLPGSAQDAAHACHAPKLTPAEAPLDWRLSATVLERKIRAFNPWPVARAELNGMRLRILRAALASTPAAAPPGEILRVDKSGLLVAAGGGALRLTEVQKPGGKPMPAAAFINAVSIKPGMRFADLQGARG